MTNSEDEPGTSSGRKHRIKTILDESVDSSDEKPSLRSQRAPTDQMAATVTISGDSNIVGNHNTIHNYHSAKPPRPRVVVKTGDGVLTAEQKSKLQAIVKDIVEAEKAAKRQPKGFAYVWGSLNKHMKVNKYDEIKSEDFDKACKFLRTMLGRLTSSPSARRRLPDWRNRRIEAIQARCDEVPGWQKRRKDVMASDFGATSLVQLSDDDLDRFYRRIMGWKKP